MLFVAVLGLVLTHSATAWPEGLLYGPSLFGDSTVGPEARDPVGILDPAPGPLRLVEPLGAPRLGLGPLIGIGIDVSQFRLLDPGTSIALDLRLSWPGADRADGWGVLQPYLALGPALLVADSPEATNPIGSRVDTTVAVGVRAGAGLTWQLDRHATLFGEYRMQHGSSEPLGPLGGRGGGEISGFDVLYGLRLRF
jgi:hypothetical protein